jgi:hypothetical protein
VATICAEGNFGLIVLVGCLKVVQVVEKCLFAKKNDYYPFRLQLEPLNHKNQIIM